MHVGMGFGWVGYGFSPWIPVSLPVVFPVDKHLQVCQQVCVSSPWQTIFSQQGDPYLLNIIGRPARGNIQY